jgi:hypothetical protein
MKRSLKSFVFWYGLTVLLVFAAETQVKVLKKVLCSLELRKPSSQGSGTGMRGT